MKKVKKSILSRLFEKLDKKLEEKSKKECCCKNSKTACGSSKNKKC